MTDLVDPRRLAASTARAVGLLRETVALFSESSSAMFLSTRALDELTGAPHPYARASMHYGSMGHALSGAIGFCAVTGQRALVFTGDGSLHLINPLPTALKHGYRIALVVLNDSRLSLPFWGSGSIKADKAQSTTRLPAWRFTDQGSAEIGGRCITRDAEIEGAIDEALAFPGSFVLDARVDPAVMPPVGVRLKSVNTMLGGTS